MTRGLLGALGIAALLIAPRPVWGFAGGEHRALSNEALELGTAVAGSADFAGSYRENESGRETLLATLARLRNGSPSYGDLVVSVDHYIDPRQFVRRKLNQLGLPEFAIAEKETRWNLARRHLVAVHGNRAHFQQEALQSFARFHLAAIALAAVARDEDELTEAFVYNALGDHFLQDFFAPGHIVTPRSRFHDLSSASLHDRLNSKGATFCLAGGESLQPLQAIARVEAVAMAGRPDRVLPYEPELLNRPGAERQCLVFRGDGRLAHQSSQATLLRLMTARSILDVGESFLRRDPVDESRSFDWKWFDTIVQERPHRYWWQDPYVGPMTPATGCAAIGCYDLSQEVEAADEGIVPRACNLSWLEGAQAKVTGIMVSASSLSRSGVRLDSDQQAWQVDYIYNASVPYKIQSDSGKLWEDLPMSQVMYMGYTSYRGFEYSAQGLRFGGFWPVDFGFSLEANFWLGYNSYQYNGHRTGKGVYGIGFGRGYGLVYAFADLERGFELRGNRLEDSWYRSVSLRLMVPMSWLRLGAR